MDPLLHQQIKEAVAEALQEQRSVLQEIFLEVVEDVGLREAIREGLESEESDRETVFDLLEGAG
ncbi:MAG TPA: hypothetical protein VM617_03140 [Thermoanaerobaculia bacterium]|nr:hypothetical protein [Thermoanaerobaculia bacterium]